MTRIRLALAAVLLTAPTIAAAQLLSVPARGAGEWVKQLKLKLEQDWEWVETTPTQVFFATRLGVARKGDIVTMWMRVEFRDPQEPGGYRSVASKDDWDCKAGKRSTEATIRYRYNNLEDSNPLTGRNALRGWEPVPEGTIGRMLLEFACGLNPVQELVAPKAK